MPLPSPLPIGISASAIARTMERVETAASYASAFSPLVASESATTAWRVLISTGDADSLAEAVANHGIVPYASLPPSDLAVLEKLVFKSPGLRSVLQEAAAQTERSIGVSIPLKARIYASGEMVDTPLQGISLFLNERETAESDAPSGIRQVFQVGSRDAVEPRVVETFRRPAHSPRLRGHIARREIARIASFVLEGSRVTPLAAPENVVLHHRKLTRAGRFSLLGLHLGSLAAAKRNAEADLARHEGLVDVLCLGGSVAFHKELTSEIIAQVRPRLTLAAADRTDLHRTPNLGIFALIRPESEAWLHLDPVKETVAVSADDGFEWISSGASNRLFDLLESRRAKAIRKIFGDVREGHRDWSWAQKAVTAALPHALRYLLFLQNYPEAALNVSAREETLIRIVGQMIEPLAAPDEDVAHIQVFMELLLECGLLSLP